MEATSLRSVSVRLPPKPQFQFVQDNQVILSGTIVRTTRYYSCQLPAAFLTVPEKAGHVEGVILSPPPPPRFSHFLVVFLFVITTWRQLSQFGFLPCSHSQAGLASVVLIPLLC